MNARLLIALALSMLASRTASAQFQAAPDDATCVNAARQIVHGRSDPKLANALSEITMCRSVGADALAKTLPTLATESDTALVARYFGVANTWADGRLARAALDLAANTSATAPARIYAFGQLIVSLPSDEIFTYAELVRPQLVTHGTVCGGSLRSHGHIMTDDPLPTNFAQKVMRLAKDVIAEAPDGSELRNAAECAKYIANR